MEIKQKRIEKLLTKYKKDDFGFDDVIVYVKQSSSIKEAIQRAFKSEDSKGKINLHQLKVGRKKLGLAFIVFQHRKLEHKIAESKSFEEILGLLKDIKITGFGDLTKYDIALRIGLYLNDVNNNENCSPHFVYLYGKKTRVAYKEIFGNRIYGSKVNPDDLHNDCIGNIIVNSQLTTWQKGLLFRALKKNIYKY